MLNRWLVHGFLFGLCWPFAALAQVDLSTLDQHMKGPRAQVLVLGTTHLSGMPASFKPGLLEPLLQRLATFKPDVIAIEALSGETCDLMLRHSAVYSTVDVSNYCWNPAQAKAATGLDVPAAIARIKSTLADWPPHPAPHQRRNLAALFMAANDRASALVQWLRLPATERHAGDGLDDSLVALLDGLRIKRNENYLIAAPLAARLGLEQVAAMDDHTGDNIAIDDEEAFSKAVRAAWNSASAQARPIRERADELSKGEDMLALYRQLNQPETLRTQVAVDFGAAMGDPSPQHYGQRYVAGWETRNLRMAANIRAAFRDRPGARVLVIVGNSHKPWLDNLLGLMQGIDLVDAQKILAATAQAAGAKAGSTP